MVTKLRAALVAALLALSALGGASVSPPAVSASVGACQGNDFVEREGMEKSGPTLWITAVRADVNSNNGMCSGTAPISQSWSASAVAIEERANPDSNYIWLGLVRTICPSTGAGSPCNTPDGSVGTYVAFKVSRINTCGGPGTGYYWYKLATSAPLTTVDLEILRWPLTNPDHFRFYWTGGFYDYYDTSGSTNCWASNQLNVRAVDLKDDFGTSFGSSSHRSSASNIQYMVGGAWNNFVPPASCTFHDTILDWPNNVATCTKTSTGFNVYD